MATNMKTSLHNRSNSVPSAPHRFISQYDEHLLRLKASEATSSSSSSISSKLDGLHALYECTDKILQLSTIQQALAQESCKTRVDELLEGSLRLLDICSATKDVLLQSTESINGLQLSVRRKGGEAAFKVEGAKYLSSRKKAKKTIQNALEKFKGLKNGLILTSSNTDNETLSMISNFKEAEAVTLVQLESLLSFISGSRGKPKERRWLIVSKLMQPNRVYCDSDQSNTNEFEELDNVLQSLFHKPCSNMSVETFRNHMENLELRIQDLEGGIERLERQLIRTRVSLLNIYNH